MPRRRRTASVLMTAVAVLASAATSPMPPTPPPAARASIGGELTLTADRPIAVRHVRLGVDVPVPPSGSPSPAFGLEPTIFPADPAVRVWVVATDPVHAREPGSGVDSLERPNVFGASWWVRCQGGERCERTYALVFQRAPGDGPALDLRWELRGRAEFGWLEQDDPLPALEVAAVDGAAESPVVEAAHGTSGPFRLDVGNRLAQWQVRLSATDIPDRGAVWPIFVRARFTGRATNAGPDPEPTSPVTFQIGNEMNIVNEGPIAAGDAVLSFNPSGCLEACPFLVQAAWLDSRPDAVHDALWSLDLVGFRADGRELDLAVEVEPVEPERTVTGTGSVAMRLDGDASRADVQVVAELGPVPVLPPDAVGHRSWHAGGVATVRADVTGGPLPAGARIEVRPTGSRMAFDHDARVVVPGGEARIAFSLSESRCPGCPERLGLAAEVVGGEIPRGTVVTVTWDLDVTMPLGSADPDSTITIRTVD